MKRKESEKRTIEKRHVILGAAACAALLAVAVPLVLYGPDLFAFFADGERLRAWVDAQGAFAALAMVALIVVHRGGGFGRAALSWERATSSDSGAWCCAWRLAWWARHRGDAGAHVGHEGGRAVLRARR
ncbi:MAG: hypothetical protein ACLTQI_08450 [Slackia sp.]